MLIVLSAQFVKNTPIQITETWLLRVYEYSAVCFSLNLYGFHEKRRDTNSEMWNTLLYTRTKFEWIPVSVTDKDIHRFLNMI
jgi:hypothetical protein